MKRILFFISILSVSSTLFANNFPDYTRMIIRFKPAQCCQSTADLKNNIAQLSEEAGVELQLIKPMALNAYVITITPTSQQNFKAVSMQEKILLRQSVLERLKNLPTVELAVPDNIEYTNDTTRADQWDMLDSETYSVQADTSVWAITQGSSSFYAGVIDSGSCPANHSISFIGGYDFPENSTDPADIDPITIWHGCHVAGTIAAHTSDQGNLEGVAPDIQIVALNVFGTQDGAYDSDITDAIEWGLGNAVPGISNNPYPVKVFNMSLGSLEPEPTCPDTVQTALNDAYAANVPVVVSAGNSNAEASAYVFANCQHVIAVAATTSSGNRSTFSNYGSSITIAAPGTDIWSTTGASPFYAEYDGTSMASPHVAGTIALILSANPTFNNVDQLITVLTSTVQAFASPQSPSIGPGIVDTLSAVESVSTATVSPPTAAQLQLSSVLSPLEYCDPIGNKIPYAVHIAFSNALFSGSWALVTANCLPPTSYNSPTLTQSGSTSVVTYSGNGLSSQYQFTPPTPWTCSPNQSSFMCHYVS